MEAEILDDDLIPLDQAVVATGRSRNTLRRWKRDGLIKDHRKPGNPNAPLLLSRREVLSVAAKYAQTTQTIEPAKGAPFAALVQPDGPGERYTHRELKEIEENAKEDLREHMDDLRRQVSRAETQVGLLDGEIRELRQRLSDKDEVIRRLENEVKAAQNKGVRGLLKDRAKRAIFGQ